MLFHNLCSQRLARRESERCGCSLTTCQVPGSCFLFFKAQLTGARRKFLWCPGPRELLSMRVPWPVSWAFPGSEPEPQGRPKLPRGGRFSPGLSPSSPGPDTGLRVLEKMQRSGVFTVPRSCPSKRPLHLQEAGSLGAVRTAMDRDAMLSAGPRASPTGQALRDPGKPLSSPSLSLPCGPGKQSLLPLSCGCGI